MFLERYLLNSDYPTDEIVYFENAEATATADNTLSLTVAHSLPFIPLIFGTWSTDEDFSNTRGLFGDGMNVVATASDITISTIYGVEGIRAGQKVYFRLYGFAPAGFTGFCKATAQSSGALIFDTDKEYSKLLFNGEITATSYTDPDRFKQISYNVSRGHVTATDTAFAITVNHYLGTFPSVMMWQEYNNQVLPVATVQFDYAQGAAGTMPYATIGENSVFVSTGPSSVPLKTHIRIYSDG